MLPPHIIYIYELTASIRMVYS